MSTMTLEDFFTLTEMKDGLTIPARVEELIDVIKKEKDSLLKSIGDATRQWTAVASTIAATENKECLDLFIQLDGLLFIDRWLKDAQAFPDESSDCFVEEAISALLQAVEKLPVDSEKLTSSGICIAVESLLNYKSIKVQDRAKALFDSWKDKDFDSTSVEVEKAPVNDSPKLYSQDPESQSTAKDPSPTKSPSDQKLEGSEGGQNKLSNNQESFQITSNNKNPIDGCRDIVTSPAKLEMIADDLTREEICSSEKILDSECVAESKQGSDAMTSESLKPEPPMEDAKNDNLAVMLPGVDRTDNMEVSSPSAASDSKDLSVRTDAKVAEEAVVKPEMEACDVKAESQMKTATACETNKPLGESGNGMDDNKKKGLEIGDGSALEGSKDQGAGTSTLEDDEHSELKRYRKSQRRYLGSSCEFARSRKNSKANDIICQTRDMDLEDGIVDALEVARRVAKEVEREVVGYYEQSCSSASNTSSSSSDRISRDDNRQHDNPNSLNRDQDLEIDGPVMQVSPSQNALDASGKAPSSSAANLEDNTKTHTQDLESSLVTDAAREPESNTEKSFWEFDLNEEFSSDDANHQVDGSSNQVSVVSASRAVVGSGIPAGPLQFEGSLGWKGSAATSAFRPASPRRASDSDRALSGGATSSGSRQRQDYLDFDLNVAEGGGDDKIINPVLGKHSLTLPSLPSGESSVELSPKRSHMLKLDLNETDDDGVLPASDWKIGIQLSHSQNCHRSPSPASSSSCMLPSMRNFDLNDNPAYGNDLLDQPTFLRESLRKPNSSVGPSDDTVISILGTKVKKNSFPAQTPLPLLNGRASESVMDDSLFRGGPLMGLGSVGPYPQPAFGYNGLAMGPTVSLTSAQVYRPGGPIPYVFDSRGAPFLPQMLGSASTVPSSYCQSPLVMNMMGTVPGPNLTVPLRPNLDLNSGFANAVETGNPNPAFFRPLFIPHGQGRPSEEQLRDGFRALSSGGSGGKRKEPDSGWEFYPTKYKHQQPPHL